MKENVRKLKKIKENFGKTIKNWRNIREKCIKIIK